MTIREASGCPVNAHFDPLSENFEFVRDPDTCSAAVAQAPLEPPISAAQQILLAVGHRPQQPQATSFAVATGRGRWPRQRRQRITRKVMRVMSRNRSGQAHRSRGSDRPTAGKTTAFRSRALSGYRS
jgi:hypothetical protein